MPHFPCVSDSILDLHQKLIPQSQPVPQPVVLQGIGAPSLIIASFICGWFSPYKSSFKSSSFCNIGTISLLQIVMLFGMIFKNGLFYPSMIK